MSQKANSVRSLSREKKKQSKLKISPLPLSENEILHEAGRKLVLRDDNLATKNVEEGLGGPFFATLAVLNLATGEYEIIGETGNAVLETGSPTDHAEKRVLDPVMLRDLVQKLEDLKAKGEKYKVILASSAQSCASCHIREEMTARYLMELGLIGKKDFVVFYGATFDDTEKLAGFYDWKYIANMVELVQTPAEDRLADNLMLKIRSVDIKALPKDVNRLFTEASEEIAAVMRGGRVLAIKGDLRSKYNLFATPEVSAITFVCHQQKEDGVAQPWMIGDENYKKLDPDKKAILITTAPEIGAASLATCYWAGINEVWLVSGHDIKVTPEFSWISNKDAVDLFAKGYGEESVVQFFQISDYPNNAQLLWAERVMQNPDILYNGITDRSKPRLSTEAEAMSRRFTAEVIREVATPLPKAQFPGASAGILHPSLLGGTLDRR